jgi:phosphate starvation-inducible protein PhoH
MFCGDFRQSDLKFNGIKEFLKVLKVMDEFDLIDFEIKDIVRSDFLKKYIIAKTDLGF